jgi:hypothetical protein
LLVSLPATWIVSPLRSSGAMMSRLVRYWLEMSLGTWTGPSSAELPVTRVGR